MEGGVETVKPENWEVKGMRKGMTLVELLVVLIGIAVIVGLAYNAVIQARREAHLAMIQAQQAQREAHAAMERAREGPPLSGCINNLRQLVLAIHAYENDWDMVPIEYRHETPEGIYGRVQQLIYSYIRDEKVFICPSDPYEGRNSPSATERYTPSPVAIKWRGKEWRISYTYTINERTVKIYNITRPFPDMVLFFCPWHKMDTALIARYDGRIEVVPWGRYTSISVITKP
jgi:prepilin-type N-terminal cleavage/methylation domain-containing protein